MLVQFVVKNFTCFKEEAKLSMVASNYDTNTRWAENVIEMPKFGLNLLRSVVIYGANASGKTKLLRAMAFMNHFIQISSKTKPIGDLIEVDPFKLNSATEHEPSLFEIIFIFQNEMYRYGFEVTTHAVVSEWLFVRKTTKEAEIFYRNFQDFEVNGQFKKGKILINNDMVKENTLLLSAAAQFKDKWSQNVLTWLNDFNILSGLQDASYLNLSINLLDERALKSEIMQFVQSADLNIDNLEPIETHSEELNNPKKTDKIGSDLSVHHKKYDANHNLIGITKFSLDTEESSGTKKYFSFSAPLLLALKQGKVTAIDELDAKLHPNLVRKMVALFHSKATNPHNAQLLFNTHDTNLLSDGLFRRDQIWFTQKDRYGASTLYSLSDFKKEDGSKARNLEDYQANYIQGRYGAIPYLGDFDKLLKTTVRL